MCELPVKSREEKRLAGTGQTVPEADGHRGRDVFRMEPLARREAPFSADRNTEAASSVSVWDGRERGAGEDVWSFGKRMTRMTLVRGDCLRTYTRKLENANPWSGEKSRSAASLLEGRQGPDHRRDVCCKNARRRTPNQQFSDSSDRHFDAKVSKYVEKIDDINPRSARRGVLEFQASVSVVGCKGTRRRVEVGPILPGGR
ncbi:hypothetical protein EDB87DRAFT_1581386 [Lactarius vividus]|nr:hypothetical protein EDB87DRAFT_1581386 [Lactarius vividus]